MRFFGCWVAACLVLAFAGSGMAQAPGQSQSSSSSSKHSRSSLPPPASGIGAGTVTNGVYRNPVLGLSAKVPTGWVLRTEEMNTREEGDSPSEAASASSPPATPGTTGQSPGGRVLLAAFSRPPQAPGEDVNASIVIAAEPAGTYPGLKEAAQYFGPLTEVAKEQGFTVDQEPYEMEVGSKVVVRADFHKDVGSRVMRQSTLAFLAHGYAVSITVIAGTEDEVEELMDGVKFGPAK